jgi:enoyl-CoA hydratase
MSPFVTYDLTGGIARISMDDGKANVMSLAMLDRLAGAFDRAERDEAVVVLRSTRAGLFSAGFDLKVFAAGDVEDGLGMVRAGAELALRLMRFPRPVVGIVEGDAYPMGAFLLLACDVRIGIPGSHRMGLNEVAIGIAPPGFAIELARSRVHPAWLSRTVTTGEMFGPQDALAAGFIDRIVDQSALESTIDAVASDMRNLHMPSHETAKMRLRLGAVRAMRAAIDDELTVDAYRTRPASSVVLPVRN